MPVLHAWWLETLLTLDVRPGMIATPSPVVALFATIQFFVFAVSTLAKSPKKDDWKYVFV